MRQDWRVQATPGPDTFPNSDIPADPTAVTGRRIAAFLADAVIGMAMVVATAMATFTNTTVADEATADDLCALINESENLCIQAGTTLLVGESDAVGAAMLTWIGASILLTMLLPGLTGWSPGKLLFGLRVVDKDTFERAGFAKNLLRGVLWLVDSFPWAAPIVGGVLLFTSKGHRRIGDLAAGTLVVPRVAVGHPVALGGVNDIPSAIGIPAAPFTPPPPTSAAPPPPSTPPTSAAPPPPSTPPTSPPPPPSGPPVTDQPPPPTTPLAPDQPPAPIDPPPAAIDAEPDQPPPVEDGPTPEIDDDREEPDDAPQADDARPEMPTSPPDATSRPGVDGPVWDDARDAYIQWDPDLGEWMEWSEAQSRWIPISR